MPYIYFIAGALGSVLLLLLAVYPQPVFANCSSLAGSPAVHHGREKHTTEDLVRMAAGCASDLSSIREIPDEPTRDRAELLALAQIDYARFASDPGVVLDSTMVFRNWYLALREAARAKVLPSETALGTLPTTFRTLQQSLIVLLLRCLKGATLGSDERLGSAAIAVLAVMDHAPTSLTRTLLTHNQAVIRRYIVPSDAQHIRPVMVNFSETLGLMSPDDDFAVALSDASLKAIFGSTGPLDDLALELATTEIDSLIESACSGQSPRTFEELQSIRHQSPDERLAAAVIDGYGAAASSGQNCLAADNFHDELLKIAADHNGVESTAARDAALWNLGAFNRSALPAISVTVQQVLTPRGKTSLRPAAIETLAEILDGVTSAEDIDQLLKAVNRDRPSSPLDLIAFDKLLDAVEKSIEDPANAEDCKNGDQCDVTIGAISKTHRIMAPLLHPWYQRPEFISIWVFLLVLGLIIAGSIIESSIRRWIPLGIGLMSVIGGWLGAGVLDLRVFLALMFGALMIAAGLGILSPFVFRQLEQIEPYSKLAPLLISLPLMRRRLFKLYASRLARRIQDARTITDAKERAYTEVYVDVALREVRASGISLDTRLQPAQSLLVHLDGRKQATAANILVQAAGGRGKSALIRETIVEALRAFDQDARSPLPIICDGSGSVDEKSDTLFNRVKTALSTDGLSDALLNTLMQAGDFFVVVDGLSEQRIPNQMLRQHIEKFGTSCPMLLASRPNDQYRDAVIGNDYMIVEPRQLDDSTFATFVSAYGGSPSSFTDELKKACRNQEGEYLPILVRMALLAGDSTLQSLSDVYDRVVRMLLLDDDDLFSAAENLCMETYWKNGSRKLVYANETAERRRIIKTMLVAGLIVPDEVTFRDYPRTVQFFHDSIQSFLTAKGIWKRADGVDLLVRAAGDGVFADSPSELLSGVDSELFAMCVHVSSPKDALARALRGRIEKYAADFAGTFSRDWVAAALSAAGSNMALPNDIGGGTAIRTALSQTSVDNLQMVCVLFARIVRELWPKLQPVEDERGDTEAANRAVVIAT